MSNLITPDSFGLGVFPRTMPRKTKITAQQIYDELLYKFKIQERIGSVEIRLGDVSAKYKGRDAIGDLLQEWLNAWLDANNYYYRTPKNTQTFPDYFLSESDKKEFLELKTFNADASPAFDLANFDSYCNSLLAIPERMDADYLILSYRMQDGNLSIANIWLKKIWEITSPSGKDPIKLQVKRKQIYNIRPCTWYSERLKYFPFNDRKAFLKGIADTHEFYPQCDKYKTNWFKKVKSAYFKNTGIKL